MEVGDELCTVRPHIYPPFHSTCRGHNIKISNPSIISIISYSRFAKCVYAWIFLFGPLHSVRLLTDII